MAGGVTIKVIKPKPFNDKAMRDYGRSHVAGEGEKMLNLFKDTVKTWEHKVVFKLEMKVVGVGTLGAKEMTTEVTTDDEIYRYVDQGTKPHIIRPKYAKRLAFPSIFSPKSRPRSLKAEAGSRGPVDTFRQEVHHPGTEARDFTKEIKALVSVTFRKAMTATMAGMAKVSGHSMK